MEKNWVCIQKTNIAYLAEIAKEVLLSNGIQAVTINKKDSINQFGVIEIYVDRKDAVKGKHILRDLENSEPDKSDNEAHE